jgi:phosphate transport system substrate-binding protein
MLLVCRSLLWGMQMIRLGNLSACAFAIALAALAATKTADAQQKILIDGSTGTAPLVSALGKAFTAKSGTGVELGRGLGTKARFEALAGGKIDIAMATHGLNVGEVNAMGMTVHRIAMTPVVFAVHQSVAINGLSNAQLCAIYEGRARNWNELGGPDLAIAALTRPDSEVDAEVVRDGIACLKGVKMPDSVKVLARAGDMARALADTTGGIGMTSATVVEQSQGKIKAIALNGTVPSESNVVAGSYRLTRDAFLVTRNAPSAETKAFIDFVKSADGTAVIRANGAIAAAK